MSRPKKLSGEAPSVALSIPAAELKLAAVEIPSRLRFLEDLQRRQAFEGSAMLKQIINDYRDALKQARGIDISKGHAP